MSVRTRFFIDCLCVAAVWHAGTGARANMQNSGACKVCARQIGGKQINAWGQGAAQEEKCELSLVGIIKGKFMGACSVIYKINMLAVPGVV